MKTILFISPTGTLDNGAEVSMFHFMKFLTDRGYTIINVAPNHSVERQKYVSIFKEAGIECFIIDSQRWWWEEAPGNLFGTREERASSQRETINIICDIIKERNVDLVISNTVNVFEGAIAANLSGKKHFWLIHEFPENEFSYYLDKIDFISDYSQEIFSVKGQLYEKMKELYPNRQIKSFIPYTEIKISQLIKETKNRIVSIGRLSERKNQLELIRAFYEINQPELELVFIGGWDDPYKKKCLDFIKENKIKNICFLGHKENPWYYVTDKDICVFPSSMETFGLVYVEALLNGVPVILSDNPGHSSAYQLFNFGCMYPSKNIDKLVESIQYNLKNFSKEKQKAESFVIEAQKIYQMSTVYEEILEAIENDSVIILNSVRHISDLLTLNEKKSKLACIELKIRQKLQRVYFKLFKK